jgi:hypothetical protein
VALDFVQIDAEGNLTGMRVALQREHYSELLWALSPAEFPLLARMGDYYDDASFRAEELTPLKQELLQLQRTCPNERSGIVREMVCLVSHSIENDLGVEAIAD